MVIFILSGLVLFSQFHLIWRIIKQGATAEPRNPLQGSENLCTRQRLCGINCSIWFVGWREDYGAIFHENAGRPFLRDLL